jgi:hypothetical protein
MECHQLNRKSLRLASAILLVLAAGCGEAALEGPPPGVDLKASQTPAVTSAPAPSKAANTAKRGDLHRPGPPMTMQ